MTNAERIAWIDQASLEELLSKWRFEPMGSPWFEGPVGEHYQKVLFAKRAADEAAWVRASKSIGWR